MTPRLRFLHHEAEAAALRPMVVEFLHGVFAGMQPQVPLPGTPAQAAEKTFANLRAYLPPRGRTLLAEDGQGRRLGCGFLKMVRPDAAEIKRLYVRPAARGLGLGRAITLALMEEARALGARELLIDTGAHMAPARALYRGLGFAEIAPYPESENDPALAPFMVYMRRDLGP
ncbi:MAG: GNAT family N-acetyltransferase [Paracoccaceae bacterium]